MRTSLLVIGLLVVLVAAGTWAFVTSAASDCDTTPGQLGQSLDQDTRGQCRLAQLVVMAALVAVIGGLVVAAVGLFT